VLIPDLLGADFGCSVAALAFRGSASGHARSIGAFLDALGVGVAGLLGHSFGGFLAQEVASGRPPWRTRKLVLLCPGGVNRYRLGRSVATLAGPDLHRDGNGVFAHA
jgi:pimeloyl-ACP methyl ester carboxylesterase